jgi:hypothetical protein
MPPPAIAAMRGCLPVPLIFPSGIAIQSLKVIEAMSIIVPSCPRLT